MGRMGLIGLMGTEVEGSARGEECRCEMDDTEVVSPWKRAGELAGM